MFNLVTLYAVLNGELRLIQNIMLLPIDVDNNAVILAFASKEVVKVEGSLAFDFFTQCLGRMPVYNLSHVDENFPPKETFLFIQPLPLVK